MKRKWKILIAALAVLVVAAVVLSLSFDRLVKSGIETGATFALKTDTSVGKADLSVMVGSLELGDLAIENPEGYPAGKFLVLDRTKVSLDVGSLLSDTVEVKTIVLDGMIVHLVQKLGETNIGAVIKNASGEGSAEDDEDDEGDEAAGKGFKIGRISITNAKLRYQIGNAPAVTVPLPDMELKDLSDKDGQPLLLADVISQVLLSIVKSAAKLPGNLMPAQLGSVLNGVAKDTEKILKVPVEAGGKAVKSIGKLFSGLGKKDAAEEEGEEEEQQE